MSTGVSHAELLERASRLHRKAVRRQVEAMRREVTLLVEELNDHVILEAPELRELPSFTARLVQRGQERLLQDLLVLALEAQLTDDPLECERLAGELVARLEAQVEAEERALTRLHRPAG
jgi:hypothetical protein